MIQKYKKTIILSVIITLLAIFSGAVNKSFQLSSVSLIYFFGTLYLLKNAKFQGRTLIKLLILSLPFILLYNQASIESIINKNSYYTLPIGLTPILFVFLAYQYSKYKTNIKLLVLTGVLIGFLTYVGMSNWSSYYFDNENSINKPFPELVLKDINGKPFEFKKDQVVILDLWSTSCGVCMKKFPDFEALKLKYQNNDNVKFYTLNLPLKRDSIKDVSRYVKDYKFESLFATELDSWEKLNNRTVPKILILDKSKTIVYKGNMNDKWYHFYNNINSLIDKQINE